MRNSGLGQDVLGIERTAEFDHRVPIEENILAAAHTIGLVDTPLDPSKNDPSKDMVDRLAIEGYYTGLAKFIESCQTPMTIAVQGDWGSGKTTALNFIKHKLPPKTTTVVEFNTWQYSQFDLGSTLIFSMVHEIMAPLVGRSDMARQYLRAAGRIARDVAAAATRHAGTAAGVGFATDAIIDSLENTAEGSGESNLAARIKKLRLEFSETIEDYCRQAKVDRVVVLIDDLDRVDPERAVEVMESLKVFFDCEKCVFVLAIDFEVVARGIRQKYGDDFDIAKARSFFDKIIQVPFRMPVDQFKIDTLLSDALANMAVPSQGGENGYERFVQAALTSVGNNPRSMKRLINTFQLLKIILDKKKDSQGRKINELVVFILLCAQTSFPDFHREIARSISLKSGQIIELLEAAQQWDTESKVEEDEPDSETSDPADGAVGDTEGSQPSKKIREKRFVHLNSSERAKRFGISETERQSFDQFLDYFGRALSEASGTWDISEEVLRTHVNLASVTSVGASTGASDGQDKPTKTDTERDARVEGNSGPVAAELVRKFDATLKAKACKQPVSSSAQSANIVSFYAMDSAEAALDLGPRIRPRILAVAYSTKGLRLQFGRVATQDNIAGKRYSGEWSDLAERLRAAFGADQNDRGTIRFSDSANSGAPFTVDGIRTETDIEKVAQFLPEIYALTANRRATD